VSGNFSAGDLLGFRLGFPQTPPLTPLPAPQLWANCLSSALAGPLQLMRAKHNRLVQIASFALRNYLIFCFYKNDANAGLVVWVASAGRLLSKFILPENSGWKSDFPVLLLKQRKRRW